MAERNGVAGLLASALAAGPTEGVLIVSWEELRRRASFLRSDSAVSHACLEAKGTW